MMTKNYFFVCDLVDIAFARSYSDKQGNMQKFSCEGAGVSVREYCDVWRRKGKGMRLKLEGEQCNHQPSTKGLKGTPPVL